MMKSRLNIDKMKMRAEAGDIYAQYLYGTRCKDEGKMEEAKRFFRLATEQHFLPAQFELAVLLLGEGKRSEAEMYLQECARSGLDVAKEMLKLLNSQDCSK